MIENDYEKFIAWAVPNYAQEQVKARAWQPETAMEQAKQTFKGLLSEGLSAPNQSFYVIQDKTTGQDIGYIRFGVRKEGERQFMALYEIVIHEAHRRHGYAWQALQAMEE